MIFLSRRHTGDLVLTRRLLGGNHALGKAHLVTARLGIDGLGTSGLFRLRFGRGRRGLRGGGPGRGGDVRGGLLGLLALGTQGGQLLTLATCLFLGLAAGLLGAELFQLGAFLGRQWLGLKLGHGTALSFKKKPPTQCQRLIKSKGGDEGSRTLGLCHATAALSQLSYVPRTSRYFTYGSPTVNAQ